MTWCFVDIDDFVDELVFCFLDRRRLFVLSSMFRGEEDGVFAFDASFWIAGGFDDFGVIFSNFFRGILIESILSFSPVDEIFYVFFLDTFGVFSLSEVSVAVDSESLLLSSSSMSFCNDFFVALEKVCLDDFVEGCSGLSLAVDPKLLAEESMFFCFLRGLF